MYVTKNDFSYGEQALYELIEQNQQGYFETFLCSIQSRAENENISDAIVTGTTNQFSIQVIITNIGDFYQSRVMVTDAENRTVDMGLSVDGELTIKEYSFSDEIISFVRNAIETLESLSKGVTQ